MLFSLGALAANAFYGPVKGPVEDTYIVQAQGDANFGRDLILVGGPGRAVFVRDATLGMTGGRCESASLVMRVLQGDGQVKSISRVLVPWGEGKGRRNLDLLPPEMVGSITWKSSRAGESRWEEPGGGARKESEPVEGWKATATNGELRIEGLGPAVQKMIERGDRNYGFRIEFVNEVSLVSSEHLTDGPRFEVKTAPAPASGADLEIMEISTSEGAKSWPSDGTMVTWTAKVRNSGDQPSTASTIEWSLNGARVSTADLAAIQPNQTASVEVKIPWKSNHKDHRQNQISAAVLAGSPDKTPANDWLSVGMNAVPVSGSPNVKAVIDTLNRHVLPQSRFSFAPEGVLERFRYVSSSDQAQINVTEEGSAASEIIGKMAGLPKEMLVQPNGIGGAHTAFGITMDTRDDSLSIPGIPLPEYGWVDRFADQFPMPESGLLGKTEAALLNNMLGKIGAERKPLSFALPSSIIFRCFTATGTPLAAADFVISAINADGTPGKQLYKGKTMDTGAVFYSAKSAGRDNIFDPIEPGSKSGFLLIEATKNGQKEQKYLPWTLLFEDGQRGKSPAASIEMRFQISDGAVDQENDSALGRPVEDGLSRFPAVLNSVVDGKLDTGVDMPKSGAPYWIEVDLGRDKMIGEVELTFKGDPFAQFSIVITKTGQTPDSGTPWIKEGNGLFRAAMSQQGTDGLVRLKYRGATSLGRYIRIVPTVNGPTQLVDVKARTVHVNQPPVN